MKNLPKIVDHIGKITLKPTSTVKAVDDHILQEATAGKATLPRYTMGASDRAATRGTQNRSHRRHYEAHGRDRIMLSHPDRRHSYPASKRLPW